MFEQCINYVFQPLLRTFTLSSINGKFIHPCTSDLRCIRSRQCGKDHCHTVSLSGFAHTLDHVCRNLSDIKLYEFFQTIGTIPTMFFCLLSEIIQYVFPETHACRTIITHLTQSENILFPDHPEFFFCVFSNLLFTIQQELIDHDILR